MSEPTTNHFPHKGRRQTGMCVSLSGVLDRASENLNKSGRHLKFDLYLLQKHINQMRAANNDQEAVALLDEFLALWVEH